MGIGFGDDGGFKMLAWAQIPAFPNRDRVLDIKAQREVIMLHQFVVPTQDLGEVVQRAQGPTSETIPKLFCFPIGG
jgi:hypothetical protein